MLTENDQNNRDQIWKKSKKVLDRWDQKWYYIKVVAEQNSSEQQNKLKKFLTNKKNCDQIIKLLAHKKRIKKDLWQLNNKTTLKILMNFSDDFSKNQRTFFIRTVINKDKEASASWTWINIEHESLILAQDERWRRA